jgi:hypothetical protein
MKIDQDILPIESIQERDVDLILLEELSTNNLFSEWFIHELSFPKLTSIIGAWRSVLGFGLGETDILFSYKSNDKKIFVLIENKLDSTFQDEQFVRYTKRANKYIEESECDLAFSILIAPKVYCENQNYFENYLTYEAIAERFEFINTKRSLFKSQLLKIASEKLRRGYKPTNSEIVQKFWFLYWKHKEIFFSNFQMKEPIIVPHNSDWPMLYDDKLNNIVFYHKLAQGNVDATFRGYSEEIEYKIKQNLPDWATFVRHGKSFSIRIFSGIIDRTKDFNEQIENINKGLNNIERIRNWIIQNLN